MKKLVALMALSSLTLVGCGSRPATQSGASEDATRTVLDALTKTTQAGSARVAMDLTVTTPSQDLHVTGDAEYEMVPGDPTSVREHVTLQIPSIAPGMPSGEVEMIVAEGPVLYFRAPMFSSFLGAQTQWVKLDPSELPQGDGALGAATGAADPAAALALIADAIDVRTVGADTVGGVDTTRYRASVDLIKLLPRFAALVPGADAKKTERAVSKMKAQLDKLGLQQLPIDIWVDGDGYVKQLKIALDVGAMSPELAGTSFSITMTFSDIGAHFSIEAPPKSQVTDITDLAPTGVTSTTGA